MDNTKSRDKRYHKGNTTSYVKEETKKYGKKLKLTKKKTKKTTVYKQS